MTTKKIGLELLREPFPAHQISQLPKPTAAQTKTVKDDFKAGMRCQLCGGWHHKDVIHLSYVGHAALTDRLLDCDPAWAWEPVAFDSTGLPAIDTDGGLWIKLTVCGITRYGYGDAQGKTGGDAMKERIGDALRNAAMRFGAALDLWHKGDLHAVEHDAIDAQPAEEKPNQYELQLKSSQSLPELAQVWKTVPKAQQKALTPIKDAMKAKLTPQKDFIGDTHDLKAEAA